MEQKKRITCVNEEKAVEMFDGFFRTTLVYNEQMMICHYSMKKGAQIPLHNHVAVQGGYVIKGKVELLAEDGNNIIVEAGGAYVFDSQEVHGALAVEDSEYVETFTPIRPEYITV
ncbi:MAG: cupin domain-containing protein, partial [Clostridia bacterium]